MATIKVDPVEWRGRKERLQAHTGRLDKAPPKLLASVGLARGVGQGCSDLPNQTRIFLADVDLDAHEALAFPPRAVTREGGFCSTGHPDDSMFPEILPETLPNCKEPWSR
jgi:hypothetical protein